MLAARFAFLRLLMSLQSLTNKPKCRILQFSAPGKVQALGGTYSRIDSPMMPAVSNTPSNSLKRGVRRSRGDCIGPGTETQNKIGSMLITRTMRSTPELATGLIDWIVKARCNSVPRPQTNEIAHYPRLSVDIPSSMWHVPGNAYREESRILKVKVSPLPMDDIRSLCCVL